MGVADLTTKKSGRVVADLETYLDRVTVRSIKDIRYSAKFLRDFAGRYDLRAALCADVSEKHAMIDADGNVLADSVFRWSAADNRWWTRQCLGLESPLARACRYESEPFWVNALGFHGPVDNPYLAAIDVNKWFAVSSVGRSAIVVPVHLPFAQVSANSFHPLDTNQDDLTEIFDEIGGILGAITHRFISGYVAAMRRKHRIPSGCELSKREVECLRWAAIGKTDREIGMILNLSHPAVRYHVQRAGEKLNSVNRAQTVFKAAQLGFLGANS